ncbi:copper-binding protein [Ramlibacter sp.]|uniref:copper-binding protein n=1 Tax=Ramlibacter sp. TaxID=1917967 RepID=UPI001815F98A|nr:copper-binding protein [Ramlibacter sp.]MBA2676150.1 copper-binding protein [Ramlibacter sp.]
MKTVRTLLGCALLAAAGMSVVLAHAQTPPADMTDAEVRKVDKDTRKITLKHGPIKNLEMPAMTMVFNVADPALLDKVQPGDKVRFSAKNESGKFTVTEIQPAQ